MTPSDFQTPSSGRGTARLLSQHQRDLVWLTDAKGHLRAIEGPVEAMLGVTPSALRSAKHPWRRHLRADDHADALDVLENPIAHLGASGLRVCLLHTDGTEREVELHLTPRRGARGKISGVVTAARPVERRGGGNGAEHDPRAGVSSLQALFEEAFEAIFVLEPGRLAILDHNRQAERMMAAPPATLRRQTFDQLITPDDVTALRAHLAQHEAGEDPGPWRGRAVALDGRSIDIELRAAHVALTSRKVIACIVRDQSRHLGAERKVLHFEQILRSISDSTVIFDLTGAVAFANLAADRLWGMDGSEWPRLGLWDLYASRVPFEREDDRLVLEGGVDHAEGEFIIRRLDGSDRVCFTSFSLIRDQGGAPAGVAAVSRDVTGERAIQQQIIQSQKMDSIGTLAGGVAHDFNNLLGGILGYAQLIKASTERGSKVHAQSEFIEQSAIRASQLTQQLLSFSRKGKYNLRVTTLNDVVRSSLTLLEGSLPKSILLHTDLESEGCAIEADPTQIEQVILNLCINARDAMPGSGWITLRTRTRDLDAAFCRDRLGLVAGPHAELMVRDTGHGIDAETLTHIFEPFYTTKELGKGTGLGLSVVYGIVKNHGGHIDVRSTPGVGTQFFIYFPASAKPITPLEETAAAPADGGTERILIVDDEATIRELATDILETYGYQVLRADDGIEAIEVFRRNRGNIGLILLDMQMPTINGLQTYRRLREIDPQVRVILSSGYGMDRDIQEVLKEGVLAFIQKPYKIHELARAVRECLDRQLVP
ncbi:MAG: response regulator [Candidatus Sumerlaeia bacterium]|nr:response regulator [Candidatus Sumerlaeia bacterium]